MGDRSSGVVGERTRGGYFQNVIQAGIIMLQACRLGNSRRVYCIEHLFEIDYSTLRQLINHVGYWHNYTIDDIHLCRPRIDRTR